MFDIVSKKFLENICLAVDGAGAPLLRLSDRLRIDHKPAKGCDGNLKLFIDLFLFSEAFINNLPNVLLVLLETAVNGV